MESWVTVSLKDDVKAGQTVLPCWVRPKHLIHYTDLQSNWGTDEFSPLIIISSVQYKEELWFHLVMGRQSGAPMSAAVWEGSRFWTLCGVVSHECVSKWCVCVIGWWPTQGGFLYPIQTPGWMDGKWRSSDEIKEMGSWSVRLFFRTRGLIIVPLFQLDNRQIPLNSCAPGPDVGIIQNSKCFEALFNFSCDSINIWALCKSCK